MTKPSPLPWTYGRQGAYVQVRTTETNKLIYSEEYSDTTLDKELSNAELIVKSVNLFPRLVEALEDHHSWQHPLVMPDCKVCNLLKEARGVGK